LHIVKSGNVAGFSNPTVVSGAPVPAEP